MRIVSQAYQHLGTFLKENVLDDHDRPVFNLVDMWAEQTEFPELAEAIDFPALFLAFGSDKISTRGQLEQTIGLLTEVYVAIENIQDTAIGSPEQPEALHYFEVCARVHELLQAYEHPAVGNLNRVGFAPFNARTNVIVYRLTYLSEVVDTSVADKRRPKADGVPGKIILGNKHQVVTPTAQNTKNFDI
ncbi:hypothetical protein SAMN02745146_0082 [Hymenobacter daecheongensis DSM 21074]|uniref:Uncharacterized protein n=1 Tax=Hymenobacter daecheongensis DSM 21074 TaxID=1121955 RepID=A0A1M6LWP9_9BACT|nr:hypothetical protein [Hymenobacter daecheongensis]SHJ75576.1 hypothetical protein SAMN02745146_0082 [Hymenobacter daecheongensis DSM 21074]